MKKIYKCLTFLILVFSFSRISGQTNTMGFTNTSENMKVLGQTLPNMFTINKTCNTLTWEQIGSGNVNTTTFSVVSTSGQWDTSSGLGEIIYNMTLENNQCSLTGTEYEYNVLSITL